MFLFDKSSRALLPFVGDGPVDIAGPEMEFDGRPSDASEPTHADPDAQHPPTSLPLVNEDDDDNPTAMSVKAPPTAATHHADAPAAPEAVHVPPASVVETDTAPASASAAVPEQADAGHGRPSSGEGRGEGDGAHVAGHQPKDLDDRGDDNTHTIKVTQLADVDQDAQIIVQGYVGEVVTRLNIDQDLVMDQDVNITFVADGNGHFSVVLDQDMRIGQEVDIDVDIYDEDGVLYIDLFVRDLIEVEQDTTLDARITDGPQGGTAEVNQALELDQDVDIDIDIEDELEERYIIDVSVEVRQDVEADQDAVIEITDKDGAIDMDLEAIQTAEVDQETIVRADFALA